MAGAAGDGGDRGVVHRVAGEARCRIGVTAAALERAGRDVRRRGHAGRLGAVVAARAVGVGGGVGVASAGPAGGALVAGGAVGRGGDVTRALALRSCVPSLV